MCTDKILYKDSSLFTAGTCLYVNLSLYVESSLVTFSIPPLFIFDLWEKVFTVAWKCFSLYYVKATVNEGEDG